LHHTGSQEVTPVAVPEEPEEQPEVQEQEMPRPTRRSVRIFQSVLTTVRALSREASPEHFLSRFANISLMLYFN
jgi:hypothetical protein